jgi:pimeloyl-ACP methyl ester carboxylesterase
MSSKSDFILVPGAWHGPEAFQPTTALLEKAGYTVHGVPLPSVGACPQVQSFDPDTQAIRTVLDKVLSTSKDAVVIMHSYGGVVGSEALAEYVQTVEKGQKSESGKVRRIVFVCAFVLPEGGSLMGALQNKPLPWMILDVRSSTRSALS